MKWLVVWVALAGGCGDDPHVICNCVICRCDEPDAAPPPCNPLTQTGCNAGEKCTWFHDAESPVALGHVGCAIDGSSLGSCVYGADGPQGFDNCTKGNVCRDGQCVPICDDNGGLPGCASGFACVDFQDLLESGGMNVAGVCTRACAPLADNDFLGSGTRAGSACGGDEGCYGPSPLGEFVCATAGSATLVHRTSLSASDPRVLNVCAQGYVPILADDLGDSTIDCVALCAAGDTYAGNPGTQYPSGQSPHRCNASDARGTFNGDACVYAWRLELGSNGPATSNTVGFCLDHSRYRYDSNGDGMIDGGDAAWPDCATLPLTGSPNAADFGCIEHAIGAPLPSQPLDLQLPPFSFE